MGNVPDEASIFDSITRLVQAGVAVHWLHPKQKRPVGADWQTSPVHTLESLKKSYRAGYNVGVRPGEFSRAGDLFLHIFDLDIRDAAQAAAAWAVVLELWPAARSAPFVISGSGGESRHLYFFSDKPFRSRTMAHSAGFSMVFDKIKGREVKKYDWEVALFGAPKQAVLPPSVHPDTGENYVWGREIDFDLLDLGVGPIVSSDVIEQWGVSGGDLNVGDDDDLLAFVRAKPMGLSPAEIDRILGDLPQDWLMDRDQWWTVGMALHHEYEGSAAGFERWNQWSRQVVDIDPNKFDLKDQASVWKSFKGRTNPIRMASLIKAAGEARMNRDHADLDDLLDGLPTVKQAAAAAPSAYLVDDLDAELGMDMSTYIEPASARNVPALIIPDDMADLLDGPSPSIAPGATVVVDENWRSYLQMTEDGTAYKPTVHNVELIIRHDPRLLGVIAYNEFTQEIVQLGAPRKFKLAKKSPKPTRQLDGHIWALRDPVNGDLWSDSHDADIRIMIEAPTRQGGYGLKTSDRDLRAAVDRVAHQNRFHPIRRYLDGLKWDGVNRVERLFVDYVGAEDNAYHREAALLWMIGAVTRVFDPGHKFDFVPILEGLQGKRKSTFFAIMARFWFAELSGDFHDRKEMVEQMQGAWIMELPELQGFSKADVQIIKAFVSAQKDKVRLSYARRAQEFPRQVVFGGTTNDVEYLRDASGGRRFWPVACSVVEINTDLLETEVDQLWAEAKAMHDAWRQTHGVGARLPLYMKNPVAAAYAKEMQESRRQASHDDVMAGRIVHWLDMPINADLGFDEHEDGEPVYRNETCLLEIWEKMMGRDINLYQERDQQLLGRAIRKLEGWEQDGQARFDKYGKQRIYRRVVPK